MHNKKGQITLFVLLGLLILIIIIVLIIIRNASDDERPREGVDQATLEQYIISCIDNVAEDSFVTLGLQGGVFDTSQSFSESVTLDGLVTPLAYGLKVDNGFPIRPPRTTEEFVSSGVTFDSTLQDPYPWPSMPIVLLYQQISSNTGFTPHSYRELHYDGFFGQFSLPKLCDPNNSRYCGIEDLYPLGTYDSREPMVRSLQEHMRQLLLACLDEKTLSQYLGREVLLADPNITITLGDTSTIVDANIPLTAGGSNSIIRQSTVQREYPVQMLATYKYLYRLLKRDAKDPLFDIVRDDDQITNGQFYIVSKERLTAQQSGRDDLWLLTVADTTSRIKDSHWEFRFIIENRAPIVEITNLVADDNLLYVEYDYVDPDEEPVEIIFTVKDRNGVLYDVPIREITSTRSVIDLESLPIVSHPEGQYLLNVTATDSQVIDWEIFTFNRLADATE